MLKFDCNCDCFEQGINICVQEHLCRGPCHCHPWGVPVPGAATGERGGTQRDGKGNTCLHR